MDVGPDEVARLGRIEAAVLETFAAFGYRRVQVPVFEAFSLYEARYGADARSRLFTFQGEHEEALRPDLTAGVARFVASGALGSSTPVQRLAVAGPCFRYERAVHQRLREFHQLGVEVFGAPAPRADVELVLLTAAAIDAAGVPGAVLGLGHAEVVRAIVASRPEIDDPDRVETLLAQLDRLHRIAAPGRIAEPSWLGGRAADLHRFAGALAERIDDGAARAAVTEVREQIAAALATSLEQSDADGGALAPLLASAATALYRARWEHVAGFSAETRDALTTLAALTGRRADVIESLAAIAGDDERARRAIVELDAIAATIDAADPSLAPRLRPAATRGMGYYTGLVLEANVPGIGTPTEVAVGGRYDGLIAALGGEARPALGLALFLERLAAAAPRPEAATPAAPVVAVLSAPAPDATAGDHAGALAVAARLRAAGIPAAVELAAPHRADASDRTARARALGATTFVEVDAGGAEVVVADPSAEAGTRRVAADAVVDAVRGRSTIDEVKA